jgi:hypothetical protein
MSVLSFQRPIADSKASFRSDALSTFFLRTGFRFMLRALGRLLQLDTVAAFWVHDPGEAAVIVVFAFRLLLSARPAGRPDRQHGS